jgi:hypothetical protein
MVLYAFGTFAVPDTAFFSAHASVGIIGSHFAFLPFAIASVDTCMNFIIHTLLYNITSRKVSLSVIYDKKLTYTFFRYYSKIILGIPAKLYYSVKTSLNRAVPAKPAIDDRFVNTGLNPYMKGVIE